MLDARDQEIARLRKDVADLRSAYAGHPKQHDRDDRGSNALSTFTGDDTLAPEQSVAVLPPEYLNPSHPRYSYRLAAAVQAWEAVTKPGNRGVKAAIESWLRDHAQELKLLHKDKPSDKAIKEVATVANWNTSGGAPKTC
jgi:hypothetical protein